MKLSEVVDTQERANQAINHAKDELGDDASKKDILAFIKKMYEPETHQRAKNII